MTGMDSKFPRSTKMHRRPAIAFAGLLCMFVERGNPVFENKSFSWFDIRYEWSEFP